MKMMQVFGVVVAIHLVVAISIIALPGCRSGGKAPATSDANPVPLSDPSITPVHAGTTDNLNGSAPVRFSPSRPASQPVGTLAPIDHQVAQLTPATLTPIAPVMEPEPQTEPTTPATTYEVQKGDSLWTISRKHGISVGELALANNLSDKATLRIGQKLIVPSKTASASATRASAPSATPAAAGGTYTVVAGDTLGGIARKHGVKLADLRAANKLRGDNLRVGQVLTLPAAAGNPVATATSSNPSPAPAGSLTHTVVAGDTLGNIARQYNVAVGAIATANNITDPKKLRVGQELRIPGAARATSTAAATPAQAPVAPRPAAVETPAPVSLTPLPSSPVTLAPDDALFNPGTAGQPVELTPAPVQLVPADGNY